MASNLVPGTDGLFCIYLRGFQDKSNEEIEEMFSEYGDVVSVRLVNENYFVRYRYYDEAKKAIDAYAGNPKVKVSAAMQSKRKSTEENSISLRNNKQDQDATMRNDRSGNDQGHVRSYRGGNDQGHARSPISPGNNKQDQYIVRSNRSGNDHQGYVRSSPHDRQVHDNTTGNKNCHDQDNARKYGNNGQDQYNEQGVRNFRGQNSFKDHRNVQNVLDNNSGGHSDNQFVRRSNEFRQNGFNNIKRDLRTSPRGNLHDKNHLGNVNSNNQDCYKIGNPTKVAERDGSHWDNNDGRNISKNNRVHDMKAGMPERRVIDHIKANKDNKNSQKNDHNELESNQLHVRREVFKHNGQINVTINKTDRKGPKDNELPLLVAQEVIIADLPPEIMQADLYKLCDFVDPLHINVHKMEEDDIVYAHVFVRSREDVDVLVHELNGTKLCGKKMLVLSVERVLRD